MRRNSKDKNSKRKNTGKGLPYDYEPKGIRHPEENLPFMEEIINPSGNYGQAEDVRENWRLKGDNSSLRTRKSRVLIKAIISIAIIISFILAVFFVLPRVLPSLFEGSDIELFLEKPVELEYENSDYRVVITPHEHVKSEPDVASTTVTEVLYNEPVVVESSSMNGYIQIRTEDNIVGYVKQDSLIEDMRSVEPDLHEYKLVVSETYKNIMSHASQGTLITRVTMNTVLYADIRRDGVYQVYLPGGETGWIGSSGVIELAPREEIERVSRRYFVSSCLSFVNSEYRENGMTMNGLSINGMVYACSEINGINIGRTIEEQIEAGDEITLSYDAVTGELIIESIQPGDIVFLSDPFLSSAEVAEMAVCTDTGAFMMLSSARTTIRLRTYDNLANFSDRIVSVRRVFSE